MYRFPFLKALPLVVAASAANAELIDFVKLTEGANQLGESAWSTLSLSYTHFTVDITGTKNNAGAFAYLDWNHAGLGVCGAVGAANQNLARPNKSSNVCNPGSDDNVTVGESLVFTFDNDVYIDKIWFNNTHDPDFVISSAMGDLITINGVHLGGPGNGYAPTSSHYNTAGNAASVSNYLSGFTVTAGGSLVIAYNNEQFYVSGMEVFRAGEPGVLALAGMALFGVGFLRRRNCAR